MAGDRAFTASDRAAAAALPGLGATWKDASRFLMTYRFAIYEITTKINILSEEFGLLHDYNPIERVSSRLKSQERIVAKARAVGCGLEIEEVRAAIRDIAGVRVVCSFRSDVYTIFDMLCAQSDVTLLEVEDYIAEPKPNGYQSLHALVQVPVFLSGGAQPVDVEIQLRTLAMDFWASLEHKIYYRYDHHVPAALLAELKDAADTAARLDARMEHLHRQVSGIRDLSPDEGSA